ncbi:MAG: EamA family transporter [Ruminococcus sp.]|nr:EamA family transporter [Ruminococcus sp.]
MKRIIQLLPSAAVLSAGLLWGMISLFVRGLSAAGLDPVQITMIRLAVAAPVFTVSALLIDHKLLKIRLRDIWMFIGTGIISIVLFNICYFYALIHSQASVAVILLYTSPAFIMLLSALIFRERITPVKILSLILTICGCVLVAGFSGGSGISPVIVAVGLASGLFYGLYTIFGRAALKRYSAFTVTVYTFIFGLAGILPLSRPAEAARTIFRSEDKIKLILLCLGVGIMCTALSYVLYTWGLSGMESGKAAVLAASEPVVGAVIGMTLYHESRSVTKIIGIIMIIAAMLVLELPKKAKKATDT